MCRIPDSSSTEDITAEITRLQPYARRLNVERTLQDEDHVFHEQHGSASMPKLTRPRNGSNADGFLATIALAGGPITEVPAPAPAVSSRRLAPGALFSALLRRGGRCSKSRVVFHQESSH
jgi:hypothetical protein